jgi:hypothetical protein
MVIDPLELFGDYHLTPTRGRIKTVNWNLKGAVRGKGSSRSASSEGNCHWGIEVVGGSRISIVGGTSSWKETLFALWLCLSSCSVISRVTPFAPTHPGEKVVSFSASVDALQSVIN